jgi:hypothetical protein
MVPRVGYDKLLEWLKNNSAASAVNRNAGEKELPEMEDYLKGI